MLILYGIFTVSFLVFLFRFVYNISSEDLFFRILPIGGMTLFLSMIVKRAQAAVGLEIIKLFVKKGLMDIKHD